MNRTILRGAQVITMAPGRPDVDRVDIVIEGDCIAELGSPPDRPDAESIDLSGRIVIPGLVNAHLHTWQAGLRGVGADWTLLEYLARMHAGVARNYVPDDMYIATLSGALNQVNCGTTTLGDWCHNNLTPEHSDAALDGLERAGIRAVFLHGTAYWAPDAVHPLAEVDRLLKGRLGSNGLLTVGMAIRGPQYSTPEVAVADCRAAKERDVVVSMHQSGGEAAAGWDAVHTAGLFGPRVNVVHGSGLTEHWLKTLLDAGVSFTSTPENELGQGHGVPIIRQLLRLGAAPSIGTDLDSVVSGEVLTAVRIALAHQRGLDHEHHQKSTGTLRTKASMTSKQALSWATVEGARALGLADRVGRLEPGKQADLVVIDARALNLWPAHDPIAAALHASIANIEAVMIAGRWRKRNHSLVETDLDAMKSRLLESSERLLHGDHRC